MFFVCPEDLDDAPEDSGDIGRIIEQAIISSKYMPNLNKRNLGVQKPCKQGNSPRRNRVSPQPRIKSRGNWVGRGQPAQRVGDGALGMKGVEVIGLRAKMRLSLNGRNRNGV